MHNTGQAIADGHTGTAGADIKAPEAWVATMGSASITVAVVDDGVSADHPDLPANRQVRLTGSNFGDGDPNNPAPGTGNSHGDHCAGIIAATQGNNQGISGIAPNCRIMPVRVGNSTNTATVDLIANGFYFARINGADVISCSVGSTSTDPNFVPAVTSEIRDASTMGRNNRGCVIAIAAGNTASHNQGNNGSVLFPANVAIAGVLTVGASDRNDSQANYSPTSNTASSQNQIVDLVAPSRRAYPTQIAGETFEVWSIDPNQPAAPGDNPWPANAQTTPPQAGEQLPGAGTNFLAYTARFGGTSAAAPEVAGVAALVLSVNPNLTQQQVFTLLTSSTDQVGGYAYNSGQSLELGYGRLNACRAVQRARNMTAQVVGNVTSLCTTGTFSIQNLSTGVASIAWSSSDTNLATIDANGNATAVQYAAGSVTFTATVTFAGGCTPERYAITLPVGAGVIAGTYFCSGCSGQTYAYPIDPNQNYVKTGQITFYINSDGNATYTFSGYPVQVTTTSANGGYFNINSASPSTQRVSLTVTKTTSCGSASKVFSFIAQPNSPYIVASPNPASSKMTVAATDPAAPDPTAPNPTAAPFNAELYDLYGKKVKVKPSTGGKADLDVSDLPDGLYNLRVGTGKDAFSKHIQISH